MRESNFLQLINACTGWRELNTEVRKAVAYPMLRDYDILKVKDREKLLWSKNDPSESHK